MNRIFDRPIAFHRGFVDLTGSVTAALFLSQAVYWQYRSGNDKWSKTREEITEETGLSRREQETARKKLRELPFYTETHEGMPRQTWYHVDLDALLQYFSVGGMRPTSRAECARLVGRNAPDCGDDQCSNTLEYSSIPDQEDGTVINSYLLSEREIENPLSPLYIIPPLSPGTCVKQAPAAPKSSRPVFVPPTLEEVKAFFADCGGSDEDAECFFDHFSNRLTRAWHLSGGRGPLMKEWKIAAKNWHRNQPRYSRVKPKRKMSDVLRGIGIEPEDGIDDAI